MYDVIIIGAGPAGLTSGLYAVRSGMKSLLLERGSPGGQVLLTDRIENFPGFPEGIKSNELVERLKKQVAKLDVEIKLEEAKTIEKKDVFFIKTTESIYESKTVILAVGSSPKKLNIPGEVSLMGRGVSYCAVCDAPFFKRKEVAVVGGGNAALEEAIYLAKFAKKVKVIHRRSQLRAVKILQEEVLSDKRIEFILNSIPIEILGSRKVTGVRIKNMLTAAQEDINVDGIFIFIGYTPNTAFLKQFVQLDERGSIVTDEGMAVSGMQGLFACGDCRKKNLRQIVTACSDGAIASWSAYNYISNEKR